MRAGEIKKAKACSLVARFGFYLLWVWLLHLSDRKRETLKSPLAKMVQKRVGNASPILIFNTYFTSIISRCLFHVAHLDEIFGNLHGVEGGALANLVADNPEG